ncbi:hypothetical protein CAPTEDRAFT_228946 [Capitella teleta]|uniref:Methyltransferase type 11 domain-containing protein n=1 Tax=Capitella teleta TaxID=283909 RepID=R7TAZ5_CAPTE|nr:hypothetical protein CAPTEDRAFT_228946 [Capitella teleta]|eukprot:ELT90869.1 hypothetical protein CAPTEDRAFT_228946 [Capitella teleta]
MESLTVNGNVQNGQNGKSTTDKKQAMTMIKKSQEQGMGFNETMDWYKDWTATYDQEVESVQYAGPRLVGEYLMKYAKERGIQGRSAILDVGAGTGLVGQILRDIGYNNIDGVDASDTMLEIAREKSIYERLYSAKLGEGNKLPMIDDTYDAAVMSGIFVQGHVKLDALLDIIRLVKPGGLIVNAMREENTREVDEYLNIHEVFASWTKKGLWKCLEHANPPVKFYAEYHPLVHVYEVTK